LDTVIGWIRYFTGVRPAIYHCYVHRCGARFRYHSLMPCSVHWVRTCGFFLPLHTFLGDILPTSTRWRLPAVVSTLILLLPAFGYHYRTCSLPARARITTDILLHFDTPDISYTTVLTHLHVHTCVVVRTTTFTDYLLPCSAISSGSGIYRWTRATYRVTLPPHTPYLPTYFTTTTF